MNDQPGIPSERKRTRATYTKKEVKQEADANYFASCLLMPREMFLAEYEKVFNLPEEQRVKELAKIFEVPEWAATQRVIQLKEDIL